MRDADMIGSRLTCPVLLVRIESVLCGIRLPAYLGAGWLLRHYYAAGVVAVTSMGTTHDQWHTINCLHSQTMTANQSSTGFATTQA
jgi:hypothetical protein